MIEEAVEGGKLRVLRGFDDDITFGYFQCFKCNFVWQYLFGSDVEHETLLIILRQNLETHIDSGHTEFFGAEKKSS